MREQRGGKVVEAAPAGVDHAGLAKSLQRAALGKRREHGHGAPAVGDLDRLTPLDLAQQLACPLTELSDTNRRHVLLIAHLRPAAFTMRSPALASAAQPRAILDKTRLLPTSSARVQNNAPERQPPPS